jgi:hypothetical protein
MKPIIHLCLVSAQATPNLTPALDPATLPRRVILLVSPDMRRRADWLEQVLAPRGIAVERWPIEDAWNVEQVQIRVLELLEREHEAVERKEIALNATGGTKPMSIAAYEAFRAYELPIFYVHPEKDRLIWLHPSGEPAVDLADRIRLRPFLLAHGARVESSSTRAIPPALRDLTDWLVKNVGAYSKPLATLNWLAREAEKGLVTPRLESWQLRDRGLHELIGRFADARVLNRRGQSLRFPDEEARFYVNGGWLEEHVFGVLFNLRADLPQIQDVARSVELVRETARGEVPNEIDVACLADNRLYLIECKTRQWRGKSAGTAGAQALYRLDTLSDLLGGLQARAMLVSYRDLLPYDRQRAADLGIAVCAGGALRNLRARLAEWIA